MSMSIKLSLSLSHLSLLSLNPTTEVAASEHLYTTAPPFTQWRSQPEAWHRAARLKNWVSGSSHKNLYKINKQF